MTTFCYYQFERFYCTIFQATNYVPPVTSQIHKWQVCHTPIGRIALLGASNFNRVSLPQITDVLSHMQALKFSQSGATSLHLLAYADMLLSHSPDYMVILAGTNDIWGRNKRGDVSNQQIALDIINIGFKSAANVNHVLIASILPTRNTESNVARLEINKLLQQLCDENTLIFLNNDEFLTIDDM